LQALREDYQIKLYQFDETARSLPIQHFDTLSATGPSTDIIGSLSSILEEHRAAPPVGVLLLSDGTHHKSNTGLEFLRQAGVRVVAVGVGTPATYRDIRVAAVQAPTLAFLHYPVEVNATLQTWGYRGNAPNRPQRREVDAKCTSLRGLEQQLLNHARVIGDHHYGGVAPAWRGPYREQCKDFPLSVARDKIRVLLVCVVRRGITVFCVRHWHTPVST
jgi:hypothetical protein